MSEPAKRATATVRKQWLLRPRYIPLARSRLPNTYLHLPALLHPGNPGEAIPLKCRRHLRLRLTTKTCLLLSLFVSVAPVHSVLLLVSSVLVLLVVVVYDDVSGFLVYLFTLSLSLKAFYLLNFLSVCVVFLSFDTATAF